MTDFKVTEIFSNEPEPERKTAFLELIDSYIETELNRPDLHICANESGTA